MLKLSIEQDPGREWLIVSVNMAKYQIIGVNQATIQQQLKSAQSKDAKSIHIYPTSIQDLRFHETFAKIITPIMSLVGGFTALYAAYHMITEAATPGDAASGVITGLVGIAAVSIIPAISYQYGRIHGTFRSWAEETCRTGRQLYIGSNYSPTLHL